MSLSSGTSIGPYQIQSLIGAAGMGEVYLARDTRLKRDVALKVLPEAFANDRQRLGRITREAELLASLNHPKIAAIYGLEDRALVMELAEGEPPQGPMPFEAAWKIASQIVDALEYAHEKGIVHRDLKPANVKVSAQGMVKLLDFGLAKAFTEQAPASAGSGPEQSPTLTIGATQVGMILGTAAYMAPEQAKGKTVDQRADIWAFGVLFYELLSGQQLFQGEDIADTLAQVLTKEPDLTRVPPRAHKLLRRCLEKDPKKRLRDIAETRHYIEEPTAPVPRSRVPVLPWAIAAAALVVAGAAAWLRSAREQPLVHSFILAPEQWSFRCTGDDGGPAVISPDGKRLAFTASAESGKVLLWVRPLDSASAQPLSGTEGAMFPFWSPDSRALGFFADGKLKRIDAAGGIATVLADTPITRGGAWNRDDVIVFAPTYTSGLMRVAGAGGAATQVTRLDEKRHEMSHRWPAFLPDGKHFLFTSRDRGVFLSSLDGTEAPRKLLDESSNAVYSAGHILYTRGSVLLARPFDARRAEFTGSAVTIAQSVQSEPASDRGCFTASEGALLAYYPGLGESQLTWFDRSGKRLGTLGSPVLLQGVEMAPDGKRAAVIVGDGSAGRSVWIYEFARGVRSRFTAANTIITGMAWSPDAHRLAISLQRDGSYVVVAKDPEGSGSEEVMVRSNFETNLVQWPRNGGMALMTRDPKTGWDIAYLPPGEKGRERAVVPVLRSEANETGGVVSPDGRWLAYLSDESGSVLGDVYVASFPAGTHRRQVSSAGGWLLRWSPNGKEIFFTNNNKVMATPVHAVGDTLAIGTPRALFDWRANCTNLEAPCFDITPDGSRFLVIEPTGPPPPIALVQNWTAAMKK